MARLLHQHSPVVKQSLTILADERGYADPACFGSTAVATPHLDTLARSGTKSTRFYAASAVCTPTRASIMTGRFPLRFDIRQHFTDEGDRHPPDGVATLPRLLRDTGYATAHVGKWHLGGLNVAHAPDRAHSIPGPREHGFEHYPPTGYLGIVVFLSHSAKDKAVVRVPSLSASNGEIQVAWEAARRICRRRRPAKGRASQRRGEVSKSSFGGAVAAGRAI